MKEDTVYLVYLVCIGLVVVAVVSFAIYEAVTREPVESPRQKCESIGGIYLPGGLSSPNCVFPPEGGQ